MVYQNNSLTTQSSAALQQHNPVQHYSNTIQCSTTARYQYFVLSLFKIIIKNLKNHQFNPNLPTKLRPDNKFRLNNKEF